MCIVSHPAALACCRRPSQREVRPGDHLEGMRKGKGARCREGRLVHGRRQRELERKRPKDGAQDLRDAVASVSLLAQTVVGGFRVSNGQRPARRRRQHTRARVAFSSAASSSALRRLQPPGGRSRASPSSHDERRRDGRVQVASADARGGVDEHHKGQPIADGRRRKPCTREPRPRTGLVHRPGHGSAGSRRTRRRDLWRWSSHRRRRR
jgi:hypothetical protein